MHEVIALVEQELALVAGEGVAEAVAFSWLLRVSVTLLGIVVEGGMFLEQGER